MKDERYVEILAGVEKIRGERPYPDSAAAIGALDWLSAAIVDLRKAVDESADQPAELVRMHDLLEFSQRMAASIESRMKQDGDKVPVRHEDEPRVIRGV
jgi:hypothetical protein